MHADREPGEEDKAECFLIVHTREMKGRGWSEMFYLIKSTYTLTYAQTHTEKLINDQDGRDKKRRGVCALPLIRA